jgi:hypothetical protein
MKTSTPKADIIAFGGKDRERAKTGADETSKR